MSVPTPSLRSLAEEKRTDPRLLRSPWRPAFCFSRADTRRYTSIMTTTAEEVLKEALQLSEGERARVAAELLASLEPDVETRDGEAWIAEVERRAQAAIGGLPGLSWNETRTRVEERVFRTRK
jgi:hypothetical protein